MAMYDTVSCEFPLDQWIAGAPVNGWETRSFAGACLRAFHISEDGGLYFPRGKKVDYHGVVNILWSNTTGVEGSTDDGKPHTRLEVEFLYDRGRLLAIDRIIVTELDDGVVRSSVRLDVLY